MQAISINEIELFRGDNGKLGCKLAFQCRHSSRLVDDAADVVDVRVRVAADLGETAKELIERGRVEAIATLKRTISDLEGTSVEATIFDSRLAVKQAG